MSLSKPVRLFCSDLDGTLIGEPESAADFAATWKSLGDAAPVLVYSTGRLHGDALHAIGLAGLPRPEFLITGVGTVIYHVAKDRIVDEFSHSLQDGWDAARVREIVSTLDGIEPQPPEHQHEWKCSWFWHGRGDDDIERLRTLLADAGIRAQVVYSSGRDLDVLPHNANKGNALRWLCTHLDVALTEVVVAGDTGNDVSMFLVPGVRGIAPENAEPELIDRLGGADAYHADGTCAAGILQGLRRFGVIPETTRTTD